MLVEPPLSYHYNLQINPLRQIVPDRKVTSPSSQSQDTQLQENLWRLTEQILVDKLGSVPYETQSI